MDDDGDADSQLSVLATSLSWWMMKNLWKQGTSDEKLRLSVVDTFFLKDGHLECWYFTSSKSGSVLKHGNKRLEWDGMMKFLLRRARSTWGTAKDSWTPGVIAMARRLRGNETYPIMLTASDLKDLREKHNVHLLDEIVAIQPYVTKKPFAGCGLFETEFERKGRHRATQAALATYELARWPAEDVQWFQEFEPCVDSPDDREGTQRTRDSSAKRVHGVIHRVLAMTTKCIVDHVERETEEVLLRVVAQYIFLPGSGQPTLLWLDSVETLSSTQQDNLITEDEAEADRNEAFMQLTRELGEVSREWTTFFPPKMGDLTDGGSIMGSGLPVNPRAGCAARETNGSLQMDATSKGGSIFSRNPAAIGLADESTVGTTGATPLSPEERQSVDDVHETEDEFLAIDRISDKNAIAGEEDVGLTAPSSGRAAADRRGHFTLPTESWARRSAGWRGLYFSGGGGDGGAERPSSEQWPRRRSTGTTMRRDGRRPDLRSASETRRPWTAPARVLEETGVGAQEGNLGVKDGVVSRRLTGSNGCYGDYCHCKGMMEMPLGGSGAGGGCGNHADNDRSPPSKMVSYRSILKSRAEGKALTLRSQALAKAGRHGAFEGVPTLGAVGETELQHQNKEKVEGDGLLPLIAQRMGLLATSLGDQGRGEYFGLCSSDRARAGVPESAQRAIEELLYEEVLSRLHPTTVNRSVTVCDACAMVYSYMDTYRKQGKHLRESAVDNFRGAHVALMRKLRRGQPGDGDSNRSHAGSTTGGHTSPLRRYSEIIQKPTPIVSSTAIRPSAREGNLASSRNGPMQQSSSLSRSPAGKKAVEAHREASKSGKGHRGVATKNGERRAPADGDRTIAELRGLQAPRVTRQPARSMRKTRAAGSRNPIGQDSRSRTR